MRLAPFLIIGAALLIWGCVPSPRLPDSPVVILNVPFVSPKNELCAATALSSVSKYWEEHAGFYPRLSDNDMERLTLIPEKKGTLQDELSAAIRQNGLVAYILPASLDSLIYEIGSGHPVIILVNRSIALYPLWHYSVITGYNPTQRTFLAHFSQKPNEEISAFTLDAMWARSGRWGIIPLPPSIIATTTTPRDALKAIWDMERIDRTSAMVAYNMALKRWPDNNDLLFALASANQSQDNNDNAEILYRKLLLQDPLYLPAINNLAWIMYKKGDKDKARAMLKRHISDEGHGGELIQQSHMEMN